MRVDCELLFLCKTRALVVVVYRSCFQVILGLVVVGLIRKFLLNYICTGLHCSTFSYMRDAVY